MNSKLLAVIAVAVVICGGAAVVITGLEMDKGKQGNISFKDCFGRDINLDSAPEKVAVVNTDIMYFMQILGVENKIVGMDTDGRDKIPVSTDRIVQSNVSDIGKRTAFSGSTAIEKMKAAGVTCVLTPTTMGIGTTVAADVIESKGITVVYVNAYGEKMLDNLYMLVSLFGNTAELKEKADEFVNYFTSFQTKTKAVMPTADPSQDFIYYMSSSSGGVGNYYYSSSELNGIVTSVSGTNRAYNTSGSFGSYTKEALYALFYDGTTIANDFVFIRGTDGYTLTEVKAVFDDQMTKGTTTVKDILEANTSVKVVYVNTHIVSGAMCCISYLAYAHVFTDSLDSAILAELDGYVTEFQDKYGFKFIVDANHPLVQMIDY